MPSKISIKMAGIEIAYEGEHDFLEKDLVALVKSLMEVAPADAAPPQRRQANGQKEGGVAAGGETGTVSTYAAKLKVASGPELILASLFQAAKVEGKASLKRKDLLAGMKSAKAYYKATYNNNLSGSLKNLVRANEINEVASDEYAISTAKAAELEAAIAAA